LKSRPPKAVSFFSDCSAERVAGVDEAGRGPLAGPVFAAAVILDPERPIRGLRDSKELTADIRERLADRIRERAIGFAVAHATVLEIDRLNIFHASMLAMRRAIELLPSGCDFALIDGNARPPLSIPCQPVVGGDAKVAAIAAASVLAKVARDHIMRGLHLEYPLYGFDQHKGYATALHLAALKCHGASPEHRRSFAPVREALELTLFS
jgi:ribonuclease HII